METERPLQTPTREYSDTILSNSRVDKVHARKCCRMGETMARENGVLPSNCLQSISSQQQFYGIRAETADNSNAQHCLRGVRSGIFIDKEEQQQQQSFPLNYCAHFYNFCRVVVVVVVVLSAEGQEKEFEQRQGRAVEMAEQ